MAKNPSFAYACKALQTVVSWIPMAPIFIFACCIFFAHSLSAQVNRERDVVYQHFQGAAMTMDVFVPDSPNGLGIIKIVSGGWKSNHRKVKPGFAKLYTDRGYTVFAVFHGSQPRYKVRDIMRFMHRAVRFIRTNADRWSIDPEKIGVTGSSAGGHLSLILATKGGPGNPDAKDPVERASSAVQAAAVFYPPTDYLNWAKPGDDAVGVGKQEKWQPAFGDESQTAEGRQALGRHMSSIYHISEKTPPVLIVHGDADPVVPLFQAESFQEIADAKGVSVELIVKEGAKHGWPDKQREEAQFVDWFDRHLLNSAGKHNDSWRLGTCDWSIRTPLGTDAFHFAKDAGLKGIQYSFGAEGNGLDLRKRENRDAIRNVVKETGVEITSLGIGLMNKIPFASTDEGEQLVHDCIEAMAAMQREAAELDDRELAAKVAPDLVLLAFFGKGDINGKPELIENVIAKLKRIAPKAEQNGITLGIESLLNEADHRYIMDQVGSSALKVYYDTGNSARMGYDIYSEIESLGSENICEIHLKENKQLMGNGPVDFAKVKTLLEKINYQGWLIIEGSTPKGMDRKEATKLNAKYSRELFGVIEPGESEPDSLTIPAELLGDWTLDLESKKPAWMRIVEQDGKPLAFMRVYIGPSGPFEITEVAGQEVVFDIKPKRKSKKSKDFVRRTVHVSAVDGILKGVIVHAPSDGGEKKEISFTGKRIPAMPDSAPDLSNVQFGETIQLFNGKDLTGWRPYEPDKINGWSAEEGMLVNKTTKTDFSPTGDHANLRTVAEFEDFKLHIEFLVEEKRNSGIYLRGMYEAQVVDRDSRMQGIQGVGAIFGKIPPTKNAGNPGGQWQAYDITLVDRHVTVVLNGIKVIDNQPIDSPTAGAIYTDPASAGPIYLQGDHTSVKYRNIILAPVVN